MRHRGLLGHLGHLGRIGLACAVLHLASLTGLVSPRVATADCGREAPSRDIRAYRGLAFMGRVASLVPPSEPGTDWTISFDVDEVLAGAASDPFVVVDGGGACGMLAPERLRVGQHIILSVGAWDAAAPGLIGPLLMWRRAPNGWRFASRALWGGVDRTGYPPAARAATTREAITTLVGGPAIAPIPAGPQVTAANDVAWTPVEGPLGGAIPGLDVESEAPVAWDGRFWVLERATIVSWGDDGRGVWREPGVWRSTDGARWQRASLPQRLSGDLSLVPWGDRLALIELVGLDDRPGFDLLVWASLNGTSWRRVGRLGLRATGRYRGCGFTGTFVASTAKTLVVTSSCLHRRGSGEVRPGLATIAAAQRTTRGASPTYSWTTSDGRTWTPHRLFTSSAERLAPRIVRLESVGTGLAAIVDRRPRQDLLWSADGSTFATVVSLPASGPEIECCGVGGIDLVPRDDGRADWLLLLTDRHQDDEPAPGTGARLWRLDPAGSWTVVRAFGSDATNGRLSTEGSRVAVLVTEPAAGTARSSRRRTVLSADGGHTFAETTEPDDIDSDCRSSLAMTGDVAVTTCEEAGEPVTRHATLWSEAPE